MQTFFKLSFVLLFALSACQHDIFFEEKITLQNNTWSHADSLTFNFSVADTGAVFNLYLDLLHPDTFPFQNIYLNLKMTHPNGKQFKRISSFDLFDGLGRPLGKSTNRQFLTRVLIQPDAYFGSVGNYGLSVAQFTRQSVVPISAVSLVIEKTEQRR